MLLHFKDLILPTGVARSGMSVRQAFEECVYHDVSGIPFCNKRNQIVGRVSLRHTLKETCIPDHVVKGAHLLGNLIKGLQIPESTIRKILDMPVDGFVIPPVAIVDSTAPLVKFLSLMEQGNTHDVFVVDDGIYCGIITRMACAKIMLSVPDD
jgi:CBS domain-containing protein